MPAGVLTVTDVALTLTSDVPATPPNVTFVVLPRFVPVIVTAVPPAVEPLAGETDEIVRVVALIVSDAELATAVVLLVTLVATVNPAAA